MDTELSRSTHPFEVACESLPPTGHGEPASNCEAPTGGLQLSPRLVNGMAPDLHGHRRWNETPQSVIAWLEEQVKSHLTLIDRKVDRLALRMETCADGITRMESNRPHSPRPAVRFCTSGIESDISPLRHSGSSLDVPPPSNHPPALFDEEAGGRAMTNPWSEPQVVAETRLQSVVSMTSSCGSFKVLEPSSSFLELPGSESVVKPALRSPRINSIHSSHAHVGHVIPMKLSHENGGCVRQITGLSQVSRAETVHTVESSRTGVLVSEEDDEDLGMKAEIKRQATGRLQNGSQVGRRGGRMAIARASESIAIRLGDLNNRLPSMFHKDRNHFVEDAYNFFDDPESSVWALRYSKIFDGLIMLSSLLMVCQTIDPPTIRGDMEPFIFATFDFIFFFEAFLRFILTPNVKGYFSCTFNWIDIVAATPIVWRAMQPGFRTPLFDDVGDSLGRCMLVCISPILRLMKMIRHFEKIHILYSAFNQSVEALPVLLYIQMMITLVFASMIYFVEPRDNIETYPQAIWLSIVTMTTVGYGDVTPQDPKGAIVVSVLVIGSMLFMAMPLGIIGSAFNQVWSNRDAVLLMSRTRDRLVKWGYTAHDIPLLFQMVDQDGDGELELEEFKELIRQMKIGLDDQRIIALFHYFDLDDSGSIDAKEFVKHIFPTAYVEMFGLVGVGKSRPLSDCAGEMRSTEVLEDSALSEPGARLMTSFRLQPDDEIDFCSTD